MSGPCAVPALGARSSRGPACVALAGAVACLVACRGDAGPPGAGAGGAAWPAGAGAAGAGGGGPAGGCAAAGGVLAPPRLRRLTRVEYGHAVAALLPELPPARRDALVSLPEDPVVDGFENQERVQAPSALWVEEAEASAVALARAAVAEAGVARLLACAPGADDRACARAFVARLGRQAFRRPLSDAELGRYLALFEDAARDIDRAAAVELTVAAVLQSPHFLYRSERLGDDLEDASRLAFLVWQSPPDEELLGLAADGGLARAEVRRAQLERLLRDPRAARAFADFVRQWLELAPLALRPKDPVAFPAWGEASVRAALDETSWLVGRVFDEGAPWAELLRARAAWTDPAGRPLYAIAPPQPAAGSASWPAQERAGLITRPAFLALHARSLYGSPPLRGMAVLRQFLCAAPPAPPADADLSEPLPAPDEDSTNRERFAARTAPARCAGCHRQGDAIGFAFEHYDAVGGFRTHDGGRPVDARGELSGAGSADGPVRDAIELSERLARSEVVVECLTRRYFQFAEGRAPTAADACALEQVRPWARGGDGALVSLVRALALLGRSLPVPAEGGQ